MTATRALAEAERVYLQAVKSLPYAATKSMDRRPEYADAESESPARRGGRLGFAARSIWPDPLGTRPRSSSISAPTQGIPVDSEARIRACAPSDYDPTGKTSVKKILACAPPSRTGTLARLGDCVADSEARRDDFSKAFPRRQRWSRPARI